MFDNKCNTPDKRRYFYALLTLCTFYAIFEDDVKRACLPPSFDLPLEIAITMLVVFFTTDMGRMVVRNCERK